jgi:hypothetical protein
MVATRLVRTKRLSESGHFPIIASLPQRRADKTGEWSSASVIIESIESTERRPNAQDIEEVGIYLRFEEQHR